MSPSRQQTSTRLGLGKKTKHVIRCAVNYDAVHRIPQRTHRPYRTCYLSQAFDAVIQQMKHSATQRRSPRDSELDLEYVRAGIIIFPRKYLSEV